jgi:hypothetical protein
MTRTELRKRKANRTRNLENFFDIAWTVAIMGLTAVCITIIFTGLWLMTYAMSTDITF